MCSNFITRNGNKYYRKKMKLPFSTRTSLWTNQYVPFHGQTYLKVFYNGITNLALLHKKSISKPCCLQIFQTELKTTAIHRLFVSLLVEKSMKQWNELWGFMIMNILLSGYAQRKFDPAALPGRGLQPGGSRSNLPVPGSEQLREDPVQRSPR